MVNLATLTGAIVVSLGTERAGLFSNNDRLAEQLSHAGDRTGKSCGACRWMTAILTCCVRTSRTSRTLAAVPAGRSRRPIP
ncbi:hypothetical protein RAA17_20275 [Komagataeibacter rhaeticus]|nr:hypothetical protein [Komagataeibacter rhaeticus]